MWLRRSKTRPLYVVWCKKENKPVTGMAKPKVPGLVLGSKIGSGTFADVYRAHRQNVPRELVAVKCIFKGKLSTTAIESIYTEIKLLKLLKHPHIVQMFDFCWDDSFIYIVMEYCDGGDLSTFIKTRQHLQEKVCQSFLQQLASALEYLRRNSVSHMDLKPQNLLLTSRTKPMLKLTDFGLAQLLGNQDRETSLRGSPLYMAPEILLHHSYDASVDLWSTGVILYECLFGRAPYSSQSLGDLIEKIKNNTAIVIPTTVRISSSCRHLLTKLLQRDPKQRLSFDEFFAHPFVAGTLINKINDKERAFELVRRAESFRERAEALPLYCQALSLLKPLIQSEMDTVVKTRLQEQLDLCLRRAEEVKTRSHSSSSSSGERNQSPGPTRRLVPSPFEELCSLAATTPSLKTALEIGKEGVQYDAEGQHSIAFDRYETALQNILPLLTKEPKGRRKELLHQQASLWMNRAETLQELIKRHETNVAEELDPEDLGQCTIQ